MFYILKKDGVLGIRLSDDERAAFHEKYGNKEFENNGAVLNNHVTIVRDLLENEVELSKYLIKGQDFVSTLNPK